MPNRCRRCQTRRVLREEIRAGDEGTRSFPVASIERIQRPDPLWSGFFIGFASAVL
jgi:hypothetical protein